MRLCLPVLLLIACGAPDNGGGSTDLTAAINQAPQQPSFDLSQAVGIDGTRLRIDFVADEANIPDLGLQAVFLCTSECQKIGQNKKLSLPFDNMAVNYADVVLPANFAANKIVIHSDSTLGASLSDAIIALPQALVLNPQDRLELVLGVRHTNTGTLEAHFLVAGSLPFDDSQIAVYKPGAALHTVLDGLDISLDANAFSATKIISVAAHDNGRVASLFGVFPSAVSNTPIKYGLPLDPSRLPAGLDFGAYHARIGDSIVPITVQNNQASIETTNLSSITIFTDTPLIENADGSSLQLQSAATPSGNLTSLKPLASTSTCESAIAKINSNTTSIYSIANDGPVLFTGCENVAPYVHIVLAKLYATKNHAVSITAPGAGDAGRVVNGKTYYKLRTIKEIGDAANVTVAINGFTFEAPNLYGRIFQTEGAYQGTITTDGTVRNTGDKNTQEGMLGFTRPDNTKYSAGVANGLDKNADGAPKSPYDYNVISSTTIISRRDNCNTNADKNYEWSAVGRLDGDGLNLLAFVSSVSEKTTNSAELCNVFHALQDLTLVGGVFPPEQNPSSPNPVQAIRLDGGTAAALYWRGKQINPYESLYNSITKCGSIRCVLYAVTYK